MEGVSITGIAAKGKGVGRTETGQVVFVEKTVPGDVVDVLVLKKKSGYMHGKPIQFHTLSEQRTEPFCEHFGICGGCQWQHASYEAQLAYKEDIVRNAVQRIGKVEVQEFFPIIRAEPSVYYRNKLEFTFSNKRWLTDEELKDKAVSNHEDVLGFHRPGGFDKIVDIKHCWLQEEPSNEIRLALKRIGIEQELPFFDLVAQEGFLRQMMIRVSTLGEVLLIIAFYENDQERIQKYLDAVLEEFPQLTTLLYCINPKPNDFMGDLDMITYHGKGYIEEHLREVRFKVGPKSFFQTNTRQAEVLYDVIVDFAELDGTQNVYDLYTGVGSIALYVSRACKQVVGIEEIKEAIEDAKVNAAWNNIDNCVFYAGDVKDILSEEFSLKHGKPDLVITDPPRAGMHPKVIDLFLQLEAPRIVYVSCNPATQARDLQLLSEKYTVEKMQPVDMFPHTHHIENVALLRLKS